MDKEKRWLTMREVAGILEVSYPTVARMVGDGRLPAVKVGRQYRIEPKQLEAFIRANTTAPPIKFVGDDEP